MQSEINQQISLNVKRLINEYGLPDKLIAQLLKIRPSTLSDLLNNKAYWKIEYIIILSHYFGLPLDALVYVDAKHIEKQMAGIKEEMKESVREYLTKKGKFETLGKLAAKKII